MKRASCGGHQRVSNLTTPEVAMQSIYRALYKGYYSFDLISPEQRWAEVAMHNFDLALSKDGLGLNSPG